MFANMQNDFTLALLDADAPVPNGVTSHTSPMPAKRFAVYRNNVVVSLVNAMRVRFPATEKIVGEEFFTAMARLYVLKHPPASPLMMQYGNGFPDFLERFDPVAELPYLRDVTQLEALRTRAYHAADAEPFDPGSLQHLDPESLFRAKLELHPSLGIVRSRYPIVSIWAMNSGEAELGPVEMNAAEDGLVMREDMRVTVQKLAPGGATFVTALSEGSTLGEASALALESDDAFDLAHNLAVLISTGAVTAYSNQRSEGIAP